MAQQDAAPSGGGELHEIVSAVSRGAPEYRQCPHPLYAALREQAPVCRLTPPHGVDTYLITRHDDARDALSDPRFSKDMHGAIDTYHAVYGSFFDALDDNVLFSDPPRHTRLRRILRSAFTPRRVEEMRPRITEITQDLLRACGEAGTVDLMTSFAFPLPIAVLCELMGIPPEDRPEILEQFAVVTRSRFDPSRRAELKAAEERLQHRLEGLISDTRAHPSDSFLSDLIQAEERLDDAELVASLWVVFFAGHKTTAYQIGNSVLNLLLRPDQAAKLREDPALVPRAVEEILRFEGSVETSTFRYAAQEAEIRGTVIPELPGADRDLLGQPRPGALRVPRRAGRDPRGSAVDAPGLRHGTHYCLGAPLARLELEIALGSLLREFPAMELAEGEEPAGAWMKGPVAAFRGLEHLRVVLGPSRRDTDPGEPTLASVASGT